MFLIIATDHRSPQLSDATVASSPLAGVVFLFSQITTAGPTLASQVDQNSQPLIQPVSSWFYTGILPVHKVTFCRIYSSICGIAPHTWLAW